MLISVGCRVGTVQVPDGERANGRREVGRRALTAPAEPGYSGISGRAGVRPVTSPRRCGHIALERVLTPSDVRKSAQGLSGEVEAASARQLTSRPGAGWKGLHLCSTAWRIRRHGDGDPGLILPTPF